jgi:hypothetical protein
MYLQRKLRACYSGEEKYRPEQMPEKKYLPVIGWTTKRRLKNNNKTAEYVDEPYLIVVGNDGKPLEVVMFNVKVMIDDRSEIDMVQLTGIVNNLTIMGKVLCEKLTGLHPDREGEEIQKVPGEGPENGTNQPV